MTILGISPYTNPAACLFIDGKMTAFAEEERFSRIKGSHYLFPGASIGYCLEEAGLCLDAVDCIAIPYDADYYPWRFLLKVGNAFLKLDRSSEGNGADLFRNAACVVGKAFNNSAPFLKERIRAGLVKHNIRGRIPKIEFVNHHLSHAISSCFFSGYDSALVLVIDGSGANCCTALYDYDGGIPRLLEEQEIPNSLGWFYAGITEFLGFNPYMDEGKTMGLAPYGKKNGRIHEKLAKVVRVQPYGCDVDPRYLLAGKHSFGAHYSDSLVRLLGNPRPPSAPIDDIHRDIAWEAQDVLESAVKNIVDSAIAKYGKTKICLSGGVCMNCKMNGALLENTAASDVFVFPAANDAGASVGAALFVSESNHSKPRARLNDAYRGPAFSNDRIKSLLDNSMLRYTEPSSMAQEMARHLAAGKLAGWFQGRMEFGPRALGNRSILANPLIKGVRDRINSTVKLRESWRPFCPSISIESKGKYMESEREAPFMIVAHRLKHEYRESLASISHVDGSMRPQTVSHENNPAYHALIKEFEKLTGHGVLLNTSMNVLGEPISRSPEDAVKCFYGTGLDALAVGPFLLLKRDLG